MPTGVIKTNKDEYLWERAKYIARKEYKISEDSDKFWKIVMGIYKKMKGGKLNKSLDLLLKGKKLHYRIEFQDLPISIENRKGSIRRGEDDNGKWETKMKYPYGYIRRTVGKDGEQLDCFIGPNKNAEYVYIIHIKNPKTGKYDEDKAFLGFSSFKQVLRAFKKHYDNWEAYYNGFDVSNIEEFKKKWKNKELSKSHVKAHTRKTKTGEIIYLKDYENKKSSINNNKSVHFIIRIKDLIKSFSSAIANKYPGGRWITITDASSPLHGRHIFIVPHKDGTATVAWAPFHSGLTHKVLQPKKAEKLASKPEEIKKETEKEGKKKPELNEEEREQATKRKRELEEAQKKVLEQMHRRIQEVAGIQTKVTKEEREQIEKEVSKIADKKERNIERLKRINKIKTERDKAIDEIISEAKNAILGEDIESNIPSEKKAIREAIRENAEEFLSYHYQIKAYQREKNTLTKLLRQKGKYKGGSDIVEIAPMSVDEIREVLENEKAIEMEIDDHYRLIINTRGGIDKDGNEIKGKGAGSEVIVQNINKGGFETMIGIVGEETGNSIMDLETYRTLGSNNAAVLIDYYIEKNLGNEAYKKRIEALKKYIDEQGNKVAKNAINSGDEFMRRANKVKQFGHGEETLFGNRVQANATALQYIQRAYESYGQAEGALNQAAELLYQFENKKRNLEFAADNRQKLYNIRKKLHLNPSDVDITKLDDGYKMVIRPSVFEKLIKERPIITKGKAEQLSTADIKVGRANINDYLPEGLKPYTPPDKNGVSQKVILAPHQQAAARLVQKEKRVYLNFEAGSGKSLAYLASIAAVRESTGRMPKTIISMPKKLMPNFRDEIRKFSDFKVVIVDSTDRKARQRLYNLPPDTIVLVNKEKFLFDKDMIENAGFDMMIVDEAHKSTQREGRSESGMSQGLSDLASKIPYFIAGTGTPTPNDLSELYFYLRTIDPEKYSNQKAFMEKYKNLHRGAGLKEMLTEILHKEIDDRVYTVKKELQHKFTQHIDTVPLSEVQRNQYKKVMEDYREKRIDVLERDQRLNRILNSTKYENNRKFDKMAEIIDNHIKSRGEDEKIIIYAQQYKTVNEIERYLKDHYPQYEFVRFDGQTNLDDIENNKKRFKTDKKVKFAIHTDAGTEGLNLQYTGVAGEGGATTAIAMASGASSYATIDQFFSRANRTGVPKEMTINGHLVLTDTPHDIRTETRLEDKKKVMNLVDNAKRIDDLGIFNKSNKITFII